MPKINTPLSVLIVVLFVAFDVSLIHLTFSRFDYETLCYNERNWNITGYAFIFTLTLPLYYIVFLLLSPVLDSLFVLVASIGGVTAAAAIPIFILHKTVYFADDIESAPFWTLFASITSVFLIFFVPMGVAVWQQNLGGFLETLFLCAVAIIPYGILIYLAKLLNKYLQ